jgi:hypothetical protein
MPHFGRIVPVSFSLFVLWWCVGVVSSRGRYIYTFRDQKIWIARYASRDGRKEGALRREEGTTEERLGEAGSVPALLQIESSSFDTWKCMCAET